MSGPKISEAELKKMRLDKLIGEENIRIEALKRQIRLLNCVLCDFTKNKDAAISKYNAMIRSLNSDQILQLENIRSSFENEYSNIVNSIDYSNACGVSTAIEKIQSTDCIKRFLGSIVEMKSIIEESNSSFRNDFVPEKIEINIEKKEYILEISLVEYLDKIENSYSKDEQQWAEQLLTQIDVLLSGNEFIGDDEPKLRTYKEVVLSIISGHGSKKNNPVSLSDVSAFAKKISRYVESYHTYISYAMELGTKVNPISAFYTESEIEAEQKTIEKTLSGKISQDYIEKSINEVMKRHGYNIDSGVRIKDQNIIHNANTIDNIYQNNGKHIRVFSSASGHTVMEIVGNCSSEAEARKRYDEQVAFCKLYPEIVEELERDYDIIVNTKKYKEPQSSCKEIVSEHIRSNDTHRAKDTEKEKAMR